MITINAMNHKYTAEEITKFNTQHNKMEEDYRALLMFHSQRSPSIGYENWLYKTDKGYKYANYGVLARLSLLRQCINNIFKLYPPNKDEKLNDEELCNINIFLHSFVINTSAIFDSIAWHLYEEEKIKTTNIKNIDIGINNKQFKKQILKEDPKYKKLIDNLCKYKEQFNNQKEIRDSLAHRIPLALRPGALSTKSYTSYWEGLRRIIKTNNEETKNQTENLTQAYDNFRNQRAILNKKKELATEITPLVCFWNKEKEDDLILHGYLGSTWQLIVELIHNTLFISNPKL